MKTEIQSRADEISSKVAEARTILEEAHEDTEALIRRLRGKEGLKPLYDQSVLSRNLMVSLGTKKLADVLSQVEKIPTLYPKEA